MEDHGIWWNITIYHDIWRYVMNILQNIFTSEVELHAKGRRVRWFRITSLGLLGLCHRNVATPGWLMLLVISFLLLSKSFEDLWILKSDGWWMMSPGIVLFPISSNIHEQHPFLKQYERGWHPWFIPSSSMRFPAIKTSALTWGSWGFTS